MPHPSLAQTSETSAKRPSATKPAILFPANHVATSGPLSAANIVLIAVLNASCSVVFNTTSISGLAAWNFATISSIACLGAASEAFDAITNLPPAKAELIIIPKAKNDNINNFIIFIIPPNI